MRSSAKFRGRENGHQSLSFLQSMSLTTQPVITRNDDGTLLLARFMQIGIKGSG